MDKIPLYQRIVASVRQDILDGRLQSGDRLPSVREMKRRWNCTTGTVQHAYQELLRQGLVISQPGIGTHIPTGLDMGFLQPQGPMRVANMVHKAESFLLDALTSGYSLAEVQTSINLAMDRWRTLKQEVSSPTNAQVIRFAGSHDMAILWLGNHIGEIAPGTSLQLTFAGSLNGLIILAEGKAELAGCHLWDAESDTYNEPYLRKLFPGKKMAIVHLANRKIGLIVSPGNPLNLHGLADLTQPEVRFVNRQSGSGTRVWLDANLQKLHMDPEQIQGYTVEKDTHSLVAQEVAENRADVGLGLKSAAAAFGLDFIPLVEECYDLVTYEHLALQAPLSTLLDWLSTDECKQSLSTLPGYDLSHCGETRILNI